MVDEVVAIPYEASFVGNLLKLYYKVGSLGSKSLIAQLLEYKFCFGAVAALNIDSNGLLDLLDWLS